MKWVLENLWTLLIIAGVVAQLLQSIKGKKGGDDAGGATPGKAEFEDPALAERTRRIREDIQRKIEQRQRSPREAAPVERQTEALEELPPFLREIVREVMPERAPPVSNRAAQAAAEHAAEVLEQQTALAERFRQLESAKAAAQRRSLLEQQTVAATTVERRKNRGALLEDLRDPAALRRAFVLREVLGPPVGLR